MKVVLHFKGGLGNQLIQYAFCHKLIVKDKVNLVFDTSHYDFYKKRRFFLSDFPQSKVSKWEYILILFRLYFRIVYKRLHVLGIVPNCKSIMQNYVDDDFDFSSIDAINTKYLFVNGYFQHLEIFPLPDENTLIKSLDNLSRCIKQNETYQLIKSSSNPIMFHLRCGDYINDQSVRKLMGSCSREYFKKGLEAISKNLDQYSVFVFSDDVEYAQNFFEDFKIAHFVKGDTMDPIQDFFLMRYFKHAVISNSTLSYMASMLSTYKENSVVLPNPWFENGQKFSLGFKRNWNHVDKY